MQMSTTVPPAIEPAIRTISSKFATSAVTFDSSPSLSGGVGEGAAGSGGDEGSAGGGLGLGGNIGSETATTSCVALTPRSVESCNATLSAVRLFERACALAPPPGCTTVIRALTATRDVKVAVTFVGSGGASVDSVAPAIVRTICTSAWLLSFRIMC